MVLVASVYAKIVSFIILRAVMYLPVQYLKSIFLNFIKTINILLVYIHFLLTVVSSFQLTSKRPPM